MELQRHHRPRVLIVDDYRPNLTALEAVLGTEDWDLVTADSGDHALRALLDDRAREIALVILDVAMPGMDGFELAELLQHRAPSRHIPLLFLTGHHTDPPAMHRGYAVGAIDYITKPFDPHALVAKVRLLVALHEYARALREEVEQLRGGCAPARHGLEEARPNHQVNVPPELPALVLVLSPGGSVDETIGTIARYEGVDSGAALTALTHPDDAPAVQHALAAAEARGRFEVEARLRERATGRWRWLLLRGSAERDEHGELLCWLVVGADIDAQRRAKDESLQRLIREQAARRAARTRLHRAELHADAAALAAVWRRPETLLSRMTRLFLERIVDWCAIDLLRGATLERVAVVHRDRTWADTAARLEGARSLEALAETPLGSILATGHPELHAGTAVELAQSIGAHAETVGRLGARSWAIVPLACNGFCGGALTLVCGAGREPLVDADVRVLARVARLIAATMSAWEQDQQRWMADELRCHAVSLLARALRQTQDGDQLARIAGLIAAVARLKLAPDGNGAVEAEDAGAALTRIASAFGARVRAPSRPMQVPLRAATAAQVFFEGFAPARAAEGAIQVSLEEAFSDGRTALVAAWPSSSPEAEREAVVARLRETGSSKEEGPDGVQEDGVAAAVRFAREVLRQAGAEIEVQANEGRLQCAVVLPVTHSNRTEGLNGLSTGSV